jgi:hypothetical protein
MGHSNMAQGDRCVSGLRKRTLRQGATEELTSPDAESLLAQQTLRFAEMSGVRLMIEKYPLDKVNEAYTRTTSGKAQFIGVLTMF